MPVDISLVLTPEQASDPQEQTLLAAQKLNVDPSRIAFLQIVRRSIDARGGGVKFNMLLRAYIDHEGLPEEVRFEYRDVSGGTPVVIAGSGPAGLFAALRLIELGFKPIVLERGKDVSARKRDIALINRNGPVDPDSNYSFGEGGAGTFSDGKLYTRSKKRGDYRKALEVFRFHGADQSILYDAHPHIGTERLPRIISAMRKSITDAGGQVVFGARVSAIKIENGRVEGLYAGDVLYEGAAVILATGHSARDIYHILHEGGIALEAKPFAMGVRVEHPQELIDSIQYHGKQRGRHLPAANYQLAAQVGGRGVYSFCMCPGGFIVPAMTSPGEIVVNGMSPSGRNSIKANSGIVTEVRPEDFAHLLPEYGPLAGLIYQEELERKAYRQVADRQIAPAQRLADFAAGKRSESLPSCSYVPGISSVPFGDWLPPFIHESLRRGFREFDKRMRGFLTNEAVAVGLESRTSSPVRIPRNGDTFMHPRITGLFPCGEGAGYAGGIISAAVDGERCAEMAALYASGKLHH